MARSALEFITRLAYGPRQSFFLLFPNRELEFKGKLSFLSFPRKTSMHGPSWIELFHRIPARLHDTLALTLVTGAEIMMQSLLRLENEFAILRGRMAGSTDAARVIVLPYHQIVNLAFTKRMLEPEVEAVFGKPLPSSGPQPSERPVADETAQVAEPEDAADEAAETPHGEVAGPTRTAPNDPPAPPGAPGKQPPPSKSILLARLRARLAEQGR
jgi:hypothetical protein